MPWVTTHDVERYAAAAGHLLADPVRETVACTVAENARARPDGTTFAWWAGRDGAVSGAVSLTPPYPLLLVAVPDESVDELVDLALSPELAPPGLNGPTATCALVAAVWRSRTGGRAELRFAQRLYALTELVEPPPVPGSAHAVDGQSVDEAVELWELFLDDTGVPRTGDTSAVVRERAATGDLVVWRDAADAVVAMAARTRPAAGVVRLGPVVTHRDERGKGFGAAVTAAITRRALASGATGVVLFTDLSNPTSNALYRRLGYAPVEDRMVVDLVR